jgi:hypothetical protein
LFWSDDAMERRNARRDCWMDGWIVFGSSGPIATDDFAVEERGIAKSISSLKR